MTGRLFVGPMSKNVVDATIELAHDTGFKTAFIPSRRQVEFDQGYVNNWSTQQFADYVGDTVEIHRDHSGPGQGASNYIDSYRADCKAGFQLIHIDPWKDWPVVEQAAVVTGMMIKDCLQHNPDCKFEVGTEEQIRKYSSYELDHFLTTLYEILGKEKFKSIEYVVVQSGTIVRALGNTGKLYEERSKEMCKVASFRGLKAKEHNSDYLSVEDFKARAECGVDTFNIAPELGVIETRTVLDLLSENATAQFVKMCVESGKWKKWVDSENVHSRTIAEICGHYQFSKPEFQKLKEQHLPEDFDEIVKQKVKDRILEIVDCLPK